MDSIRIDRIDIENKNRIVYSYSVQGEWAKYFSQQRTAFVEYDADISSVPDAVLALPFVCNILPLLWLCDAEMDLKELDADFLEELEEIKTGYRQMYPMLSFKGKLNAEKKFTTPQTDHRGAACFFSGGVDAFTTFFRHIEEKPKLLTIWGSDVPLTDHTGWEHVRKHVEATAHAYGVGCHFIRSDFRSVLRDAALDRLVSVSGDGWWHGFQHGIALIAHAAPLAYIFGWKNLYIASSFTGAMETKYTCASDPSIDNHIRFCGCQTIHDGYELDRQQKVRYLVGLCEKTNKPLYLHVCWESGGGTNCSRCEKCYRTILELISEGADPNRYGFSWGDASIRRCRYDLMNRILLPDSYVQLFYRPIQERMKENKELVHHYEKYRWLIDYDLSGFNDSVGKKLRRTRLWGLMGKAYDVLKRK